MSGPEQGQNAKACLRYKKANKSLVGRHESHRARTPRPFGRDQARQYGDRNRITDANITVNTDTGLTPSLW